MHVLEGDEPALVGSNILSPEELEGFQILVGDGSASVEGHSQGVKFLMGLAGADAQD